MSLSKIDKLDMLPQQNVTYLMLFSLLHLTRQQFMSICQLDQYLLTQGNDSKAAGGCMVSCICPGPQEY